MFSCFLPVLVRGFTAGLNLGVVAAYVSLTHGNFTQFRQLFQVTILSLLGNFYATFFLFDNIGTLYVLCLSSYIFMFHVEQFFLKFFLDF